MQKGKSVGKFSDSSYVFTRGFDDMLTNRLEFLELHFLNASFLSLS